MKIALTSDLHYGYSVRSKNIMPAFFDMVEKEEPEYLLIAGDIISHDQKEWDEILKIISRVNCPIGVVFGNHDYWNSQMNRSITNIRESIIEKLHRNEIRYLPMEPILTPYIHIYGFDGWYSADKPETNDDHNIPYIEGVSPHVYLRYDSEKQMMAIPEYDEDVKQIVVTHFDYNGSSLSGPMEWFDIIKTKTNFLCAGHTHKFRDDTIQTLRIINAGSDYEKPKVIFRHV